MEGTFWAFTPAIVAIVLALVSKQVYVSLFIGIFTGALLYADGNILQALGTLYTPFYSSSRRLYLFPKVSG